MSRLSVDYVIFVGAVLGYVVVVFRDDLVPAYFSYDALRIQGLARRDGVSSGDISFENVASIYRELGLADNRMLAGLLGYTMFILVALLLRARTRPFQSNHPLALSFGYFVALFFGSVYLGTYSKDVFILPIVALAIFMIPSRWSDLLLLATMVAYAALFRNYWYIVAILYLIFRLATIDRRRLGTILAALIVAIAVGSIAVGVVIGTTPDHLRTTANEGRVGSVDASSAILPFVSLPEPWGGTVNNVITGLALLVPIPLGLRGDLYYVFLSILISAIWITVVVAVVRRRNAVESGEVQDPRGQEAVGRCVALLLAFVATQALFEPDYGSAIRHLTPLLIAVAAILSWSYSMSAEIPAPHWRPRRRRVPSRLTIRSGR